MKVTLRYHVNNLSLEDIKIINSEYNRMLFVMFVFSIVCGLVMAYHY